MTVAERELRWYSYTVSRSTIIYGMRFYPYWRIHLISSFLTYAGSENQARSIHFMRWKIMLQTSPICSIISVFRKPRLPGIPWAAMLPWRLHDSILIVCVDLAWSLLRWLQIQKNANRDATSLPRR